MLCFFCNTYAYFIIHNIRSVMCFSQRRHYSTGRITFKAFFIKKVMKILEKFYQFFWINAQSEQ